MFFIAYREKPDESLYSFASVGSSVTIGRDKRTCAICLGVKAQGVSRLHLTVELRTVGSRNVLFARDSSTYGTGYNGGLLTVVKERELKDGDVLQVGAFFFVIGFYREANNSEDEADRNAQGALERQQVEERCPVKRASLEDAGNEKKRMKLANEGDDNPGTSRNSSAKGPQKGAFSQLLFGKKSVADHAVGDVVPDSVASQLPSDSRREDAEKRRRAAAQFLPSSDEEVDSSFSCRFSKKQKRATNTQAKDTIDNEKPGATSTRARESRANATVVADSCDVLSTAAKSSRLVQTRLTSRAEKVSKVEAGRSSGPAGPAFRDASDTIVRSVDDEACIADLEPSAVLQPLMSSTQVGNEAGPIRERRRLDQVLEELVSMDDVAVNGNPSLFTVLPAESGLRRSSRKRNNLFETASLVVSPKAKRNAVKMASADVPEDKNSSTTCSRSNVAFLTRKPLRTNQVLCKMKEDASGVALQSGCRHRSGSTNTANVAALKVVKQEPVETEENAPSRHRNHQRRLRDTFWVGTPFPGVLNLRTSGAVGRSFAQPKNDVRIKTEPQEENENLVFGMDLETLRHKLEKSVNFEYLERKTMPDYRAEERRRNAASSAPNYKRFRKAAQGCFSQARSSEPVTSQIVGSSELTDFRLF